MEITSRLTENDFIRVNFSMLYGKGLTKGMTVIGLLMLIVAIAGTFVAHMGNPLPQWFFAVALLLGVPLSTYLSARRNYRTNARVSETITYRFHPDHLEMQGESFYTTLTWDKWYRVTGTGRFLLFWQNAQVANVLPKRDFTPEQLLQLKQLLQAQGVRHRL
ncbi:MAG: YcxB family protein [Chitinophagaceae bacterium]|nr:MAG: YcxB family protein [Chitinophagaceae bacterium]